MNTKKIRELIELMTENELTELEVEQEGSKVKLVRNERGTFEQVMMPAPAMTPQAQAAPSEQPPSVKGREVKAPMVGTFYRSPAPEEPSFVQVGDTVNKGDVICIIEAMKLMNEVKAEFGGKIMEIPVENAEPVEFGQTIFIIDPQS